MSDNIPFEVQEEIIKKLPVESLIRFRSVSKAWKSLIDSSDFIAHYRDQVQRLLVKYYDRNDFEHKYVSIVDDDNTFPQQKVSVNVPLLVSKLKGCRSVGNCPGLLCLDGIYDDDSCDDALRGKHVAVIWNVFIRKAVVVVVPNVDYKMHNVFGFGVCRETSDSKIVQITHSSRLGDVESSARVPTMVEVFTLSTGSWRRSCSNLPRKSVSFIFLNVVIDGLLYWLVTDEIVVNGGYRSYNLIVSFDITSEEFGEINLPDSLAELSIYNVSVSKVRESLVVLEHVYKGHSRLFGVWMMEDGVSKLFTKLFTIYTPDVAILNVLGFRKSGELVVVIVEVPSEDYCCELVDDSGHLVFDHLLAVYEPSLKHLNNLGINGAETSFKVYPCMETLLLLDQPDLTVYDNGKH